VKPLSPIEARVLGTLIEKQYTVPDTYPMSLNGILVGCNQKTSRSPVMDVSETEAQLALDSLKAAGLVMESNSGRVSRYSHNFERVVGVLAPSAAILAVLMLRGPQTPGELRTNCERLHRFADISAVQSIVQELAANSSGALVAELPRQPGSRENRWMHLLGEAAPPALPPSIEQRVSRLEQEVADLKAQLAALRAPAPE
jgi:uncharacterized protein YceH (UPF0502 family)